MIKIYLAVPYSGMEESSYEQANEATAKLLKLGFNVISPITHSHPMKQYDMPGNWEFWREIDFEWIDWCDILLVLIPKEGKERVEDSVGVQAEINYFTERKELKVIGFTIDEITEETAAFIRNLIDIKDFIRKEIELEENMAKLN